MLHNKANSSSWAHFGHDSHTNQKEMIFLILQIPLGSGRRWHILHWVQVPSELLRSSLDGSTIQSYPESTSLGIVAGWSWFFEMYIAPTSNILSSWDWLSSHFGDIQPGATHCRVGPEGVNQLPLGQDLLKPDTLTWRMEAVSTWKGTWFYDWSSRRCSFLLTRHGLKCWWVLLISKNKLKRTRSYDVFRSLRAKKTQFTHSLRRLWWNLADPACLRAHPAPGEWQCMMCCGCCHEVQQRIAQLQQGSRHQLPCGNLNIAASMENDLKNDGYP